MNITSLRAKHQIRQAVPTDSTVSLVTAGGHFNLSQVVFVCIYMGEMCTLITTASA